MNLSDFEQQLRRQPMQSIPAQWRSEILEAAAEATEKRLAQRRPARASWWREELWPWPLAWGGLACGVWIGCMIAAAVLMSHSSRTNAGSSTSASSTAPLSVIVTAIRERREMVGFAEPAKTPFVAPKPKAPGPSSQGRPSLCRA